MTKDTKKTLPFRGVGLGFESGLACGSESALFSFEVDGRGSVSEERMRKRIEHKEAYQQAWFQPPVHLTVQLALSPFALPLHANVELLSLHQHELDAVSQFHS